MSIPAAYANVVKEFQRSFPVNPVALAEKMGVPVFESDKFKDTDSGLLGMDVDGKPVIIVNKRHSVTRQAFTIAHELGHFMLHQPEMRESKIPITGISLALHRGTGPLSSREREMEVAANEIAAEILMPEADFREAWEKYSNKGNLLDLVAKHFGVSPAAANVRAANVLGAAVS